MWYCNPKGLPACHVTIASRELLPHVFTLAPPKRGGYFLWHLLLPDNYLPDTLPFGSMAPCVARTFLSPLARTATEYPAIYV